MQDDRQVLFGDLSLVQWLNAIPESTARIPFELAFRYLKEGNRLNANEQLKAIIANAESGSRDRLEAWHTLRLNGIHPAPSIGKDIIGVVTEISMPKGLDVLAAYVDRSVIYLNYSGASIIWDVKRRTNNVDEAIASLLSYATHVIAKLKSPSTRQSSAPLQGNTRISLLTPNGIYVGEGPTDAMSIDPFTRDLFRAATILLQVVTAITLARRIE